MAHAQKKYAHLAGGGRKFLQHVASGKERIRITPGTQLIKSEAEAKAVLRNIQSKPGRSSEFPD